MNQQTEECSPIPEDVLVSKERKCEKLSELMRAHEKLSDKSNDEKSYCIRTFDYCGSCKRVTENHYSPQLGQLCFRCMFRRLYSSATYCKVEEVLASLHSREVQQYFFFEELVAYEEEKIKEREVINDELQKIAKLSWR